MTTALSPNSSNSGLKVRSYTDMSQALLGEAEKLMNRFGNLSKSLSVINEEVRKSGLLSVDTTKTPQSKAAFGEKSITPDWNQADLSNAILAPIPAHNLPKNTVIAPPKKTSSFKMK